MIVRSSIIFSDRLPGSHGFQIKENFKPLVLKIESLLDSHAMLGFVSLAALGATCPQGLKLNRIEV